MRLGLKRAWSDGTTVIELSTLEFVEKLAAIIPPPRANQTLYAGVLAGNAAWRAEVVPKVATSTPAERDARAALKLAKAGTGGHGATGQSSVGAGLRGNPPRRRW